MNTIIFVIKFTKLIFIAAPADSKNLKQAAVK